MNQENPKKGMIIWLVSLFILFVLVLIIGIMLEKNNINFHETLDHKILIALLLLIFPSLLFVFSYYRIKKKVAVKKIAIEIVIGIAIPAILVIVSNKLLAFLIIVLIVLVKYIIIKKKGQETFERWLNWICFALGIILLIYFSYMIIRNFLYL